MEEWEERLKGKKIRKHSKSAVDRIIEKNELKHKNLLKLNEKSCSNDKLEVKSKNGYVRNSNKFENFYEKIMLYDAFIHVFLTYIKYY